MLAGLAVSLAGCGNRETNTALHTAKLLEDQKQYQDADDILVAALRAREAQIRGSLPEAGDQLTADEQMKKVQSDPEILKMERAQVPLYLRLERPDLASAVYSDILVGDPADKIVFDTLQDKDPAIRTGAVRVLGLAGQPAAIDALAAATKDSDQDVRRGAVAALGTIQDPRTVPPLLEALKDSYWFARSEAADALGRESDSRAVEPLFGLLNDSDKTVQNAAENALVMLSGVKGISPEAFAAHLNDPNLKVMSIAAVCLALQKDARATPVLLKMAASDDANIRLHAVKALGETGDPTVLPTLRELLKDPDVNVRGWTIIGLGKLNDQESVPALRAIAADPGESDNIKTAANAAVDHITSNPAPTAQGP